MTTTFANNNHIYYAAAILARGRRVERPPCYMSKKNLVHFCFHFLHLRKYLCLYIAKCQSVVCVILFPNAVAS